MTIRTKLLTIALLFLMPISVLAYFFTTNARSDIAALEKEKSGFVRLTRTWPVLVDTALTRKGSPLKALPATLNKDDIKTFLGSKGEQTLQALEKAFSSGDRSFALEEIHRVMIEITDHSDIRFDKDLSGSYLAEIVTGTLPELIVRLNRLKATSEDIDATKAPGFDDAMSFLVNAGAFKALADGIDKLADARLDVVLGKDQAGKLRPTLEALAAKNAGFQDKAAGLVGRMRSGEKVSPADNAAFYSAYDDFISAINTTWQAVSRSFDTRADERLAALTFRFWSGAGFSLAAVAAALALSFSVAWSILSRISSLETRILDLADRDSDEPIQTTGGHDEISRIAKAVAYFHERNRERLRDALLADRDRDVVDARRRTMNSISDRIRQSVGGVVETLHQATRDVGTSIRTVSGSAGTTLTTADDAAQSLRVVTDELTAIVGGLETLTSSINNISEQATDATRDTQVASERAVAALSLADELVEQTGRVGEMSTIIKTIASQTNLLALNATIEAARAGEMGRGFAIVAAEVKELARQTADATETIDRTVDASRRVADQVKRAIEGIETVVTSVTSAARSVAEAVNLQSQSTEAIQTSLGRVNIGAQSSRETIDILPAIAGESHRAAGELETFASTLEQQANVLAEQVQLLLAELAAQSEGQKAA